MPVRGAAKMVSEVLAFVVAVVTLVAWFSGKSSLPDLIGSRAPRPPKSAASPSSKHNPLTVALTMGSDGRVGKDRYKGRFGYSWAIRLNGQAVHDCSVHDEVISSSSGENVMPGNAWDCFVPADEWPPDVVQHLSAGVYTITLDVTTKQGYKASASHSFTLVK